MNQPQGGTGNCMDDVKRWWTQVPIGVKSIFYATIGINLFSMLVFNLMQYLYCSPILIIHFQIWRMFTTQFCEMSLIGVAFGLLSLTFTAQMLERSIGTIPFVIDFLFKNFLIQLLNFIIVLLLSFVMSVETKTPSFGLFNIVILYMSLRCFSDPETPSRFMCFPIEFRNKYQPFAIVIFFTLLSSQLRLDFFAAIIIGYIEVKFYGGMILRLSDSRIGQLKNSFLFKALSTRSDFVDPNAPFIQVTRQQEQPQASTAAVSSFQGRGVTIGGSPNTAPPAAQSQPRPNQQQYVVNPSQQQQQQGSQAQSSGDFQQFVGKGVSIGGGTTLSIQQQRELQLKRFQQQEQEQASNDNKLEMDTNADTSNDSSSHAVRAEQKQQQTKDGYTTLNEDLL